MQHVDDREDLESGGSICGPHVPRVAASAPGEEGECYSDMPSTLPRLHAEPDRHRTWPVAADCAPDAEADEWLSGVPTEIARVCDELKAFLLEKNRSYGNSAFEPINIFSKLPAIEGILIRIDDKLKRIRNGQSYPGDNDVKDLAGYLILLMVMQET